VARARPRRPGAAPRPPKLPEENENLDPTPGRRRLRGRTDHPPKPERTRRPGGPPYLDGIHAERTQQAKSWLFATTWRRPPQPIALPKTRRTVGWVERSVTQRVPPRVDVRWVTASGLHPTYLPTIAGPHALSTTDVFRTNPAGGIWAASNNLAQLDTAWPACVTPRLDRGVRRLPVRRRPHGRAPPDGPVEPGRGQPGCPSALTNRTKEAVLPRPSTA
jgi:hypothetical protein